MNKRATVPFEVTLTPKPPDDPAEDSNVGLMSIDQRFLGDLEAMSHAQIVMAGQAVRRSAGYVAVERVGGVLAGRTGTFVLQHGGTMNRGTPQLTITVVPNPGTGRLAGLTGTMEIDITDDKHTYSFDYTLAETV